MSALFADGTDHQSQSKMAGASAFWVGLLTVEATVAVALVAIFVSVTQVENQVATWPARAGVSCDHDSPPPTQPGGPLREISGPHP
jgi:hypothetical protein